ncbi:MAG: Flp pilus assembly protein CpaB [Sphingomonadales bacterium]|nr:Flp pilus assembly protein CpaB [Sphingomonadales bacterium]
MDKKKLMLLLGAAVVSLGSALAVRSLVSGHAAPVVQAAILTPQGPRVLVALRSLPVGTIITPDAVAFQPWPKDLVQDAYFIDGNVDKNKLIGTVVRNAITAGQPLTQGALVAPGDRGFLAAALGPGMRAITIPVSEGSDVAGFIFPGDHVDMMLTQQVKSTSALASNTLPLDATETVLRNLRVLATDQTTETEVNPNGKTVVKTAHNVTLEVTPQIAEKIEVAQTLGALSLSLRPLAENQAELDKAIASGTLKLPAGASKQDTDKLLSEAANRPIDGATSFSTGGDVSRFARRSMPPTGSAPSVAQSVSNMVGAFVGPTVKVARGNTVTAVPVGAHSLASQLQGLPPMGGAGNGWAPNFQGANGNQIAGATQAAIVGGE